MKPYPTLRTERWVLREFTLKDAPELHQLAQAWEVARMMLRHPHPYEEGMAEEWISGLRPMFEVGKGTTFALELRQGEHSSAPFRCIRGRRTGRPCWVRRELAYWASGSACLTRAEDTPPRRSQR
jgi:RimJ/RimL family protein N-acetyltransferase